MYNADGPYLCFSVQDDRGISPLGVAVGFNRVEAVKELLVQGADKEQKDKQGNTVLHYAAGLSSCVSSTWEQMVYATTDSMLRY